MMREISLILLLVFLVAKPVVAASEMETFTDSNFSNRQTRFLAGQEVFIKIESDDPGEGERVLKLKDNQYNDITTFQLSREGANPYIYKVSFAAPQAPGFYSIEATVASANSQNKLVRTIQVGSHNSINSKINLKAEVKGIQNKDKPTPIPTVASEPTPTPAAQSPTPEPDQEGSQTPTSLNFWQWVVKIFQNVLEFISPF